MFRAALGDIKQPIQNIPGGHFSGNKAAWAVKVVTHTLSTVELKNKWSFLASFILFHISSNKGNGYAFLVPAAFMSNAKDSLYSKNLKSKL